MLWLFDFENLGMHILSIDFIVQILSISLANVALSLFTVTVIQK